MNIEVVKSVVRSLIQLVGMLLIIGVGVKIPLIVNVNEALQWVSGNIDIVWQSIQVIIGAAITLAGFFKDKTRFEEREIGARVKRLALAKRISVSEFITKSA